MFPALYASVRKMGPTVWAEHGVIRSVLRWPCPHHPSCGAEASALRSFSFQCWGGCPLPSVPSPSSVGGGVSDNILLLPQPPKKTHLQREKVPFANSFRDFSPWSLEPITLGLWCVVNSSWVMKGKLSSAQIKKAAVAQRKISVQLWLGKPIHLLALFTGIKAVTPLRSLLGNL